MTETVEEEAVRRLGEEFSPVFAVQKLITEHRATQAELEAFRREVSKRAEKVLAVARSVNGYANAREAIECELSSLVIPQPDPLAECLEVSQVHFSSEENAQALRDAAVQLGYRLELIKIVEATDAD